MKLGLLIVSGVIIATFVVSTHFGAKAYFQTRQLKTQVEIMTVGIRVKKQQGGDLVQKMSAIQGANGFVNRVRELQLSPEQWDQYDVNIQDAVTFEELAGMLEQCTRNKDVCDKPLSFYIAMNPNKNYYEKEDVTPIPVVAESSDKKLTNPPLGLKGVFFVRP